MDSTRCPVVPFIDEDGTTRPGRLRRRGDRVLLMVTRDSG